MMFMHIISCEHLSLFQVLFTESRSANFEQDTKAKTSCLIDRWLGHYMQ